MARRCRGRVKLHRKNPDAARGGDRLSSGMAIIAYPSTAKRLSKLRCANAQTKVEAPTRLFGRVQLRPVHR